MENYIGTIVLSIFLLIVLIVVIICFVKFKDDRLMILCCMFIFSLLTTSLILATYDQEYKEVKYPYDKLYTVQLYYYDGGTETKKIRCKGYQTPRLLFRRHTVFSLGETRIPNVTRYKTISIKQIDKTIKSK